MEYYFISERDAKIVGIQACQYIATNVTTGKTYAYLYEPCQSRIVGNFYTEDSLKQIQDLKMKIPGIVYRLIVHPTVVKSSIAILEKPKQKIMLLPPEALQLAGLPSDTIRIERRKEGKKTKIYAIREFKTEAEVEVYCDIGDYDIVRIEVTEKPWR